MYSRGHPLLAKDFVDAQSLWQDPDRLEIPARCTDEPRVQVIGRICNRVLSQAEGLIRKRDRRPGRQQRTVGLFRSRGQVLRWIGCL